MFKSLSTIAGVAFVLVGLASIFLAYIEIATNTFYVFGGMMVFLGLSFIVTYIRTKAALDRQG